MIKHYYPLGCIQPLSYFRGRWVREVVEHTLEDWLRISMRDRKRMNEAEDRARNLIQTDDAQRLLQLNSIPVDELSVDVPASGFGHDGPCGPSEAVHDLLAYLCDEIAFCPSAHFVIPTFDPITGKNREKVQPPFVHGPSTLHISRRSSWQRDFW